MYRPKLDMALIHFVECCSVTVVGSAESSQEWVGGKHGRRKTSEEAGKWQTEMEWQKQLLWITRTPVCNNMGKFLWKPAHKIINQHPWAESWKLLLAMHALRIIRKVAIMACGEIDHKQDSFFSLWTEQKA